ncbi:ribonuclease [Aestuariivirga litoralis]|uniref:Ribonuclease n=2 Tax=Aestuariivirga litoralis TaxID=2650924 RepID=A0A2W2AJR5_9HYPH|nr:ribonuclease [Aestuariivirga litoralis]
MRAAAAGLALLVATPLRADEPMDGTFRASRSCEALLSIRKETNPGKIITGPGMSYRLLARNQKKATHYRIEIPGAEPPERWVAAECGKAQPAPAGEAAPAPAAPKPVERAYVLALSWQPAFCEANPGKRECRWQTGSRHDANYLSLHGLWPQPSSLQYCDLAPAVRAAGEGGRWKDIPPVELNLSTQADLERMMPGAQSLLERHEWAKHGSCYPADAETYFRDSFRLLEEVNASPVATLLMQNIGRQVSAADIRAAFDQAFGPGAGNRVRVTCKDDGRRRLITEITLALKGDIPSGSKLSELLLAAAPGEPGCPSGFVDPVGPQ